MHRDAGREAQSRDWEHQPRCGWDDFQAARRRHLMRLAAQSDRFNRRGAPPDERFPSTPRRGALTLADRLCEGTPYPPLVSQQCEVLVDASQQTGALIDQPGGDLQN